MYSASISSFTFEKARRSLRKIKHNTLKRHMTKLRQIYDELVDSYPEGDTKIEGLTLEQYKVLAKFIDVVQDLRKNEKEVMTDELTELYLEVNRFLKIYEIYNHRYITYVHAYSGIAELHLRCLDASTFLHAIVERIKCATFFSATLSPISYYIDMLGGNKDLDPSIILPSPFPIENLKLLVAPKVSIRYRNREESYPVVAEYIKSFIKNKVGNYFIYCPSYEYLDKILPYLNLDEADYHVQNKEMTDMEKEEFLLNFVASPTKTTLGFLVIGGAFSEGIDLISDRLIGAVIIGIGLPRINFASDEIATYYKENGLPGHDYAYTNPGMNKIMQAVGRVIRSETDKGAVLLIDDRYMSRQYNELFRTEWRHYEVVLDSTEVEEKLSNFFKN